MRRLIFYFSLGLAQAVMAQGLRFTPPPAIVNLDASLAQPGKVPAPLLSTNINLEIVNWSTALTPTPERGEFLLKLHQAVPIGSVLVYASGEVSAGANSQWTKLGEATKERKLQALPVTTERIDSIKLTAPAEKQPNNTGFRAVVPFLTVLPVRTKNIAPAAELSASSADPRLLVDGIVEESQTVAIEGGTSNAWIKLSWKELQSIRGLAFFGGHDPTSIEDLVLEFSANNLFRMIDGRPTDPGSFRKNTLFVCYQPFTTREVRIRHREKQKPIRLGEIVILQELPPSGPPPSPKGL